MAKPVLYGFDASTYVRTVRMQFAEKNVDYDQVPVNVLEGEPHTPEHLARHPFGKVPVLEHDGLRIIETSAIVRYVEDVFAGPPLTPDTPRDRARMNMAIALIDSYGYGSLIGGVAAYHLFPQLVGGQNDDARREGLAQSQVVLKELMRIRGDSPFIAGERQTLADCYLAPICFYVGLTEDADQVFDVEGFAPWWDRAQALKSFRDTEPDLGE